MFQAIFVIKFGIIKTIAQGKKKGENYGKKRNNSKTFTPVHFIAGITGYALETKTGSGKP